MRRLIRRIVFWIIGNEPHPGGDCVLSQDEVGRLYWQKTICMDDDEDDGEIIDVEPPERPKLHEYKIGL